MRNSEGYKDPTAGKAMNPHDETKTLKSITASPREKPKKKDGSPKKILYHAVPAYVSHRR